MGTVIRIDNKIVRVRFEDNNERDYLIDNFVMIPKVGDKVTMNKNGLFIDCTEKSEITKSNSNSMIITLVVTLFFIIFIFVIISGIRTGREMHEGVTSCIEDCQSGKNKCPD